MQARSEAFNGIIVYAHMNENIGVFASLLLSYLFPQNCIIFYIFHERYLHLLAICMCLHVSKFYYYYAFNIISENRTEIM